MEKEAWNLCRVNVSSLMDCIQSGHGILGDNHQVMLKNLFERATEHCKVTQVLSECPRLDSGLVGRELFRSGQETEGPPDQRLFQRWRWRLCWEPCPEINRKVEAKEAMMERWPSSAPTFEREGC